MQQLYGNYFGCWFKTLFKQNTKYAYLIYYQLLSMLTMFDTRFYISLVDFNTFDREHYVIGQNEKMLRIKVNQYDYNYPSQDIKIKYRDYWADHILQNERQSVTYSKVSDGIIQNMIHGFDNIILACGPHCSGKTFNITGWNHKSEGIASRLIEEMLTSRGDGWGAAYAMSCVEIKDNRVFDLLSDNWKQPCSTKNVSKHVVCAVGTAKRKLWEAHSKRTAVVRENDNWVAVRSHVCDYVVTFYQHASAPKNERCYDATTTESKCSAKVHIIELAGAGPNTSKLLRHQIQANRNVFEISQFLDHIANVNIKDNRDSIKNRGSSTLLKYCQESFSKQRTSLRVMCHIRPELAFLNTNISVLELGEALRKLPNNVINVPITEPEIVALYKQKEHFTRELYLYRTVKDIWSMANMTAARYEWLRNKVLNFLMSKNDNDTVLSKWNYVDGYMILSVFKEYYDQIMENEKTVGRFEFAPFPLKSLPVDKNLIRLTTENSRQAVNQMLAPLSSASAIKNKYWDEFVALNPSIFSYRDEMSANVREAHRTWEIYLGILLGVHEKLLQTRDRMDKLRRKRHLSGNEQYDGNMNVIVSAEEKCMFQNLKQTDKQMLKANDDLIKNQKQLNSTLLHYSKLNDTINMRFEEYLNNQTSYVKIVGVKTSRMKSVKSVKNPSRYKKFQSRLSES